ncbi:MAG: hypothetical protein M1812_006946 [Candelaria pacifica]|nr:MAG: hypothetical protein M1812_006946 [Candelaria pacifica]
MPNSQTSGNSNEGSGQGGGGGGSSTTDMMQGNSSQFSQTNPDVQLDTDGDATQFSDDCLDLNRQIGSCWANLNMAAWIRLWVARNTPCAAIANCTMVAPGFTTWTTHFIEATASINSQCYSLQSTYCNPETYRDPGDAGGDRTKQLLYARYAYGAWTIRSIFNFFHSWSVATDKALNSAVTQIPLMTQVSFVDVKDKHNWYADVIATGITLGVALIPGAEPAAPFMYLLVNQGIKAIGGALPAASKELWPKKPSVDDQIMLSSDQLASLIDAPGDTGVRSIFQNNLDVTLRAIQGAEAVNSVATNDVDAFLNATDSGRFSDNATVLQLNANNAGQLAVISSTMNTYLLTTLLKQNGYRPILLPGVNPAAVYQSTNNCPEWAGSDCSDDTNDLGCKGELDAYGMCKNVWFSKAFNSSFILLKDDGTKLDQTIDVLHAIVDNGLLANRGDVATAFRYIFEYPAICSLRNVFPPNANPYYSDDNGGGFYYLIDAWPEAAKSSLTISNIVSFLPIAPLSGVVGHGFVDLRIDPKYAPKLIRPNNTVYSLNPSNVTDTYCISQFSVDIATFWAGAKAFDWGKNAPEPM